MRSDLLFDAIKELRQELEDLDHVIRQVESLAEGRNRRGRPPAVVTRAKATLRPARLDSRDNDA
ncbi:MAG: hypothetical protein R2748_31770 [Bryobacterales bacterium]